MSGDTMNGMGPGNTQSSQPIPHYDDEHYEDEHHMDSKSILYYYHICMVYYTFFL